MSLLNFLNTNVLENQTLVIQVIKKLRDVVQIQIGLIVKSYWIEYMEMCNELKCKGPPENVISD